MLNQSLKRRALESVSACRSVMWTVRTLLAPNHPVRINYWSFPSIRLFPEGQVSRLCYVYYFERRLLKLALDFVQEGMVAVDVGANIGLWSVVLARKVGPGGKVYSFEPSRESFGRLRRNLQLNRVDNVVSYQSALGAEPRISFLLTPRSGGDADRFVSLESCEDAALESVTVTTLDKWAVANRFESKVNFLKIDCEGSELFVLRGGRDLLSAGQNMMIVSESNPTACARYGYQPETLYQLLTSFGFGISFWDFASHSLRHGFPPQDFNGSFIALKQEGCAKCT